jgi:hypothetical protein
MADPDPPFVMVLVRRDAEGQIRTSVRSSGRSDEILKLYRVCHQIIDAAEAHEPEVEPLQT